MEQPEELPAEDARDEPDAVPEFDPTPEDELGIETHMEAGKIEAVGGKFRDGRADALSFADFLKRTVNTVYAIAQDLADRAGDNVGTLDMLPPEFASAKVTFILGPYETPRLDETSPSRDAAAALSDLLETPSEDMLGMVEDYGADSVYALKRLLGFVKEENLEVKWEAHGRQAVEIDGAKATASLAALDREGEIDAENLTVEGHLEMTDAGTSAFKLRLLRGEERPEQLKRKRKVEGKFSELVSLHVMEQNLWNNDVIATLRVEAEREGTSAAPRPPKFELVGIEKAPDRPPPMEPPKRQTMRLIEPDDAPDDEPPRELPPGSSDPAGD